MYMASWSFVEQLVVRQNLRGPCLSSARRPKSINKDPPDVSLLVLSQKHIKSRCFYLQHLQFAIPVVLLTLPERHLKALTFVTVVATVSLQVGNSATVLHQVNPTPACSNGRPSECQRETRSPASLTVRPDLKQIASHISFSHSQDLFTRHWTLSRKPNLDRKS